MKEIIEDVRRSLEGGVTLYQNVLKAIPKYLITFISNLIKAGEASGKLDVFLIKLVESLEKKRKI